MKYQILFCLKNNEKVYINVVCCSPDWHFRGKSYSPVCAQQVHCGSMSSYV